MEYGLNDQMLIRQLTQKENELIAAQECRDIIERLFDSSTLNSVHAYIMENALDDYESKLYNEIQSLEDLIDGSIYDSKSYTKT